jgi:hypothetical protein
MEVLHSSETLVNFYHAMPFNIPGSSASCTGGGVWEETSPWYKEHDLTNRDQSALHQNKMKQSLALPHHASYLRAGETQKVTRHRQYDLSSNPGRGRNFSPWLHNQASSRTHQPQVNEYQGFSPCSVKVTIWLCLVMSLTMHEASPSCSPYAIVASWWDAESIQDWQAGDFFFKNCQLQYKIRFEMLTVVFFVALSVVGRNASSHENTIQSLWLLPELNMFYALLFGSPIKLS